MTIITRHVLKAHVGPFLFSMATIVFIFMLNVVFKDLARMLGKGIPAAIIFELFFFNIAWIFALAVPMAVLIATVMAFGNMSADNEIIILKAGGVHLYRLIFPVIVVSILISALMIRFNDVVLPEFNIRAKQLYADISKKKPTASLEPNVFFTDIPNYGILVRHVSRKNDELKDIIIHDTNDSQFSKTIIAKTGRLHFSEQEGRLILMLYDGEIHQVDIADLEEYHWLQFDSQIVSIPVHNMVMRRGNDQHRGDREKNVAMMMEVIRENQGFLNEKQSKISQRAFLDLNRVLPPELFLDSLDSMERNRRANTVVSIRESKSQISRVLQQIRGDLRSIAISQRTINKYWVELHKKFSIPVASVVFVLIGAPLGIMARQGGVAAGAGFGLVFFIVYWAFLIGGEQLADRGFVSPVLSMWAANIIVGSVGIFLVIQTVQESHYIQWNHWKERIQRLFRKRLK